MDLTLAILNGGRGTRLGGRDKSQLLCEGRTLLERLLDLRALCTDAIVITEDIVPGKGAPGGVVTALLQAKTAHVLLVCGDMPRVSLDAVRDLIAAGGPALFEGQPFPGIYPAALGPSWRDRLVTNPSMHALIASARFANVPLRDPDVIRSVNTLDDARSLRVDIP
jgi:molybdenum cofactor guanylyltransferase